MKTINKCFILITGGVAPRRAVSGSGSDVSVTCGSSEASENSQLPSVRHFHPLAFRKMKNVPVFDLRSISTLIDLDMQVVGSVRLCQRGLLSVCVSPVEPSAGNPEQAEENGWMGLMFYSV